MDTTVFATLVKANHPLGRKEYVIGRISGIMAALCEEDLISGSEFERISIRSGELLTTETTVEKYENFTKVIEDLYAGLCVFDYLG